MKIIICHLSRDSVIWKGRNVRNRHPFRLHVACLYLPVTPDNYISPTMYYPTGYSSEKYAQEFVEWLSGLFSTCFAFNGAMNTCFENRSMNNEVSSRLLPFIIFFVNLGILTMMVRSLHLCQDWCLRS